MSSDVRVLVEDSEIVVETVFNCSGAVLDFNLLLRDELQEEQPVSCHKAFDHKSEHFLQLRTPELIEQRFEELEHAGGYLHHAGLVEHREDILDPAVHCTHQNIAVAEHLVGGLEHDLGKGKKHGLASSVPEISSEFLELKAAG